MMMRLGIAQRRKIWGRGDFFGGFLQTQFWENGKSYKDFIVENHKFYFDIPQIIIIVFIFINKTWDFVIILIHVFNNINKHKLLQ
jgi:hypothetical protein